MLRNSIILTSSVELICVMALVIIMSNKEKLSRSIVDLVIILLTVVMLVALMLFVYNVLKNGFGKK